MKGYLILRMVLLLELLQQGLVFGRFLPSFSFTATAHLSITFCFIHCLWKIEAMPVDAALGTVYQNDPLQTFESGKPYLKRIPCLISR